MAENGTVNPRDLILNRNTHDSGYTSERSGSTDSDFMMTEMNVDELSQGPGETDLSSLPFIVEELESTS